ncbi:multiple monosaccharide ABC transporter permease [Parageobacillus thermoglucosidasius]|uniref:Xylose transport system permease protein XylH n=1 Tax=Parageobacillus thermoglucosidasius TaxID=1426 RepID=A0AAN0YQJ1_PARTM|nr:multiple monosaccharide ABC transporter permease [Parageobacillus thermoglucosidasius]ALF10576.1 ABC transporter permease [Parageobacillus thermoglucosidasius]ANZ30655.1 ABC transporter permease [Parageobacillus thermoglucosidasius]APM81393.1 ABC transporter permease [Parageobacillus thermoglucosidasius]KJX67297.1 ABC transporter permease [Parageobacillus thermoglucosidasius]MED4905932.1 sugar ABC transporter permease [Parageobacillus thermoglucosidasius]
MQTPAQKAVPHRSTANESKVQLLKQMMKNNMRSYGMVIALVLIILLFQVLTEGILLRPLNITNLILQNSYILVLAIGMMLVIITGHIDLSVGSVAAFVGALAGILMVQHHVPMFVTVLISLLLGALIGAWQGFWVAYVKIPAFIVTLAGMLLFRGLTMIILEGQSIAPFPKSFQNISSGFLPDLFHGQNLHIFTLVIGLIASILFIGSEIRKRNNQKKYGFAVSPAAVFGAKLIAIVAVIMVFSYVLATYEGIPTILIILATLIIAYSFVSNKTVIGRHIYAIGGNEKAAQLSGIKTKRVTFWVFVNMGVLAALSGLIFAARLNAATPKAGNLFELDAIAACFIGGASAYGGVGTISGAIIGGLVMGVINNGMSLLGLGIDWQQAIKGLVLLAAVAFDIYNKNKAA